MDARNFGTSRGHKNRIHTSFGKVHLLPSSGVQDTTQSTKLRLSHLLVAVDFILIAYHARTQPDFFKLIYYTDNIYKVYKDKLQNRSCNQFHYIGTYK